jgi:hypothetical protein
VRQRLLLPEDAARLLNQIAADLEAGRIFAH